VTALVPALLGACAVALLVPVAARPDRGGEVPAERADDRPVLARFRAVLLCLAIAAGWTLFGGVIGLALGGLAGVFSWRAVAKLEKPSEVRRRHQLERDLPIAVHLFAACLTAGAAPHTALASVSEALPGAVGEEFALLQRRLHWGVDPAAVWRSVDGPLEPLGRCMARAHESGASVQHAVARLADDVRRESRAKADARARTIEVRAAAPLGICFLPAFVLLGVVPMAAGLFSSLQLFR
jgi:Flp pilus assembly protein TadB